MHELMNLHQSGIWLRRQALDFGYRDRDLYAARRAGEIVRVRHGAYISADAWNGADQIGRHLMRADATLMTHGDSVALSHTTAAAAHGLRLWQPGLDRVHLTQLRGGVGGITDDIVYHVGRVAPEDLQVQGERQLVVPIRAALETAALHSVEEGLVVLDSLVDLGMAGLDEMHQAYARMKKWPHCGRLQVTVRLVRKGAQSVGESRSRYLCWRQHLPEPALQFEVRDGSGNLIGTVDFAWPDHRLLGEFDGRIKYGRLLKPGQDPGDVVFAEKEREDLLREITGWAMIRLGWRDLDLPHVTAQRIRRKLRMSA
ncbi:MAG TPA: type IV toxin-antitoxin system AbiEi family antitoxin domain-containing protein [Marmoricola sp.]|nr:type IV toxin-antitoxin system AbiEi family antitoxin domain-containing protein [Marmoricola sp.]